MPLCFLDFLTWFQFPRIFVGDCVFQRPMPRFTHMSPIDLGWSHKANISAPHDKVNLLFAAMFSSGFAIPHMKIISLEGLIYFY